MDVLVPIHVCFQTTDGPKYCALTGYIREASPGHVQPHHKKPNTQF